MVVVWIPAARLLTSALPEVDSSESLAVVCICAPESDNDGDDVGEGEGEKAPISHLSDWKYQSAIVCWCYSVSESPRKKENLFEETATQSNLLYRCGIGSNHKAIRTVSNSIWRQLMAIDHYDKPIVAH